MFCPVRRSYIPPHWLEYLLGVWGADECAALQKCCAKLLTEHTPCSTTATGALVVVGERTGLRAPVQAAMTVTTSLLALGAAPTVLFSGGVTDRKHFGEFPAGELAREFFSHRSNAPLLRDSIVDQASMNSATQSLFIARLIRDEDFRNVFLVLPYEHLVRFAAVLVGGFLKEGLAKAFPPVNILPVCYGSATDHAPSRLTLEREGFGPPRPELSGEDPELEHVFRQRAGQYGDRWRHSFLHRDDPSWPCGAAPPSELLSHLRHQPFPL